MINHTALKILFISGLIMGGALDALACPGAKVDFAGKLKDKLMLSEEQTSAIKDIFTSKRNDCTDLDTFQNKRQCWSNKREEIHNKISAILTDEQRVEFEKLKEKKRTHHKKRFNRS